MGRGRRAQSPVLTRAPPGKHREKEEWSPPWARPPTSFSVNPRAGGAGGSLPALTCPARALFHGLLPSVAVWAWVSLLRSSTAR